MHQIMSAARGAILQASFMTPSGIQSSQVSQLSQFVPMRQELGTGMRMGMTYGMCYAPSVSMVLIPSASLHPSLLVGFPLASLPGNLVLPLVQVPLIRPQTLPAPAETSTWNLFTGFSSPFNFQGQRESGSQAVPITAIDHK